VRIFSLCCGSLSCPFSLDLLWHWQFCILQSDIFTSILADLAFAPTRQDEPGSQFTGTSISTAHLISFLKPIKCHLLSLWYQAKKIVRWKMLLDYRATWNVPLQVSSYVKKLILLQSPFHNRRHKQVNRWSEGVFGLWGSVKVLSPSPGIVGSPSWWRWQHGCYLSGSCRWDCYSVRAFSWGFPITHYSWLAEAKMMLVQK
jgi:hypothetical protein